MVDAKSSVLAAHSDDLIDHVELVLGDLRSCILLTDHLCNILIPCLLDLEEGLCRGPPMLLRLLPLQVIVHDLVRLHVPVIVFLDDVVVFGEAGALSAL